MSNQPIFDPLNASPEEEADMVKGYRDGWLGKPPPALTSYAYEHGRKNGSGDRNKSADDEQRALARRTIQEGRV